MIRTILGLCCLFLFSGCEQNVIATKSIDMIDVWTYEDELDLQFNIDDTDGKYDLLLDIIHDPSFGYENLYVIIKTSFPSGEVTKDVVSLNLAGPRGSWLGKCNNTKCSIEILLNAAFAFKETGSYTLSLAQHSREESLQGIKQVSFRLVKLP